jgi:hypothetical protein
VAAASSPTLARRPPPGHSIVWPVFGFGVGAEEPRHVLDEDDAAGRAEAVQHPAGALARTASGEQSGEGQVGKPLDVVEREERFEQRVFAARRRTDDRDPHRFPGDPIRGDSPCHSEQRVRVRKPEPLLERRYVVVESHRRAIRCASSAAVAAAARSFCSISQVPHSFENGPVGHFPHASQRDSGSAASLARRSSARQSPQIYQSSVLTGKTARTCRPLHQPRSRSCRSRRSRSAAILRSAAQRRQNRRRPMTVWS